MMAITKDNKHYMAVAHLTGQRSYAKRAKVGAVIVKNRSIISEGYNGTYPGDENVCEDENGLTKSNVIHAEKNAIMKIVRSTYDSTGSELYVTHEPCLECASLIVLAGIKEVFYAIEYKSKTHGSGLDLLLKHGVECVKIQEKEF